MIAEVCSYCGRKNPDQFPKCVECGTPLTDEEEIDEKSSKEKSKRLGLLLALVFGPIGLAYTTTTGAVVMGLITLPFFVFARGTLWVPLGYRLICYYWAFLVWKDREEESKPHRQALRLLHEAANLEGTDREKAILTYEEVIRSFPNTSASQEAARNIEILKKSAESHS